MHRHDGKRKETEDFFAAFADHAVVELAELEHDEEVLVVLWDTNRIYFDIYRILQDYYTDSGNIDTYLMIQILKERKLPIEETALCISYLHSGYRDAMDNSNEIETPAEQE